MSAAALALATAVVVGGELNLQVPPGWTLRDEWFREIPLARLYSPEGEAGPRISLERAPHFSPKNFPPAKRERLVAGVKTPVYEVAIPSAPARVPDFDEFANILGPGLPGVRSKIERCKDRGMYTVVPGYKEARKDPKLFADFKKNFLENQRTSASIDVCLGFPVLAKMRRGEPIETEPQPPDEAELARLERLERQPASPAERQAVAAVALKDRVYVIRYTAAEADFEKGAAVFEQFLDALAVVPPTPRKGNANKEGGRKP